METMLQVECVDGSNSTVLSNGEIYYAFPIGNGSAAYISRFPRKSSHTGAFQMSRFKVVEPVREIKQQEDVVAVNEIKKASIHQFAYSALDKTFIAYGFVTENKIVALYSDKNLTEFIGTTTLTNCEILDSLGKTPARKVFPKPITTIDLNKLDMQVNNLTEQGFEQLSLF